MVEVVQFGGFGVALVIVVSFGQDGSDDEMKLKTLCLSLAFGSN
jgi:hypothetical protein